MGTATRKLCDSCKISAATLFCRSDSAFLCPTCDSRIHATHTLASRHARVSLCEVCEHAPAHVTCKADAATLCVTCDHDIHSANPLASRHVRVAVVPFFSSSARDVNLNDAEEEAASWLVSNTNMNSIGAGGAKNVGFDTYAEMEDPYLDLDQYGVMVKEEVDFGPVTEVVAEEECDGVVPGGGGGSVFVDGCGGGLDACFPMDFGGSKAFDFYNNNNGHSISHSLSSSSHDVGVVPDAFTMIDVSNPFGRTQYNTTTIADSSVNQAVQLTGVDREARVLRYREKRKNRKFEKTIRYASRKAYAETRPRIKGRFAKRTEMEAEVDQIYGYGIVPSF